MATNQITLNQKFLDWLNANPNALAEFTKLIIEFFKVQGEVVTPVQPSVPEGPIHLRPDEPPVLTTVPITSDELDAMMEDRATAAVKEKALTYVKGFLAGLVIGTGL